MKKFFKVGCLGIIGIIVLIAIIAAIGGGGEDTVEPETTDPATETEETTETPTEETTEEPTEEVVGIGEELVVGDVHFTANEVSTAQNLGGEFGVNAQSQFLIINITIQNEKNEAITVDSSFFELVSGERTYESDSSAAIYANEDTSFFLENVNPGVALTGNVVFDVPADLENMQLQVQTGMFGTETGVINLQ